MSEKIYVVTGSKSSKIHIKLVLPVFPSDGLVSVCNRPMNHEVGEDLIPRYGLCKKCEVMAA